MLMLLIVNALERGRRKVREEVKLLQHLRSGLGSIGAAQNGLSGGSADAIPVPTIRSFNAN